MELFCIEIHIKYLLPNGVCDRFGYKCQRSFRKKMITVKVNSLLCITLWENQSKFMRSNLNDALYQVTLKILIKRLWGKAGYQTSSHFSLNGNNVFII